MQVNFLDGKILPALIRFAIPVFFSLIFQQLYSTVDTIIIGHTLGETSLAAMGSAAAVYDLFLGFTNGMGSGLAIVTARNFGTGAHKQLKKTTAAALVIALVTSLLVTIIAYASLNPFLRFLKTEETVLPEAYAYVSTIVLFFAVSLAYNLCSGLMRAIGNSVMPLIFLMISSISNIGLDLLFILVFKMGIRGAAIATVIAQVISVICCIIYILKKVPLLIPEKEHFKYDPALYKEMVSQGISMGLMSCIVQSGTAILQSGINSLGYLVVAGHVAARKLFSVFMMFSIGMMQAVNTFVSQNFGANQADRIRKGMKIAYIYNVILFCILGVLVTFIAPTMIRLISGSDEAVILQNGTRYLRFVVPCMAILGLLNATRTALQAIGQKILPVISSVMELIGKILFVIFFIPKFGYNAVIVCEPVMWVLMDIELLLAFWLNPYIRKKK
ncbi:MAG: MATE family efflux transporter [Clostridiales bacterium]|nr:MATE family efflux transporter [Candidatus Blautia equi]